MIAIHPITSPSSPRFLKASQLFETLFPDYQHDLAYIRACAAQRSSSYPALRSHLWLIQDGDTPVGLRIFSYMQRRNLGYGAFLALRPKYRGWGIGSWLVHETLQQLAADATTSGHPPPPGYCLEVEIPALARDADERRRREAGLAFYYALGAYRLDLEFVEPLPAPAEAAAPPADQPARPMYLLFCPMRPGRRLTSAEEIELTNGLYQDVYRLGAEHPYLQQALRSIDKRGKS